MRTELFNEASLYVNDLVVAERFYTNIMGLMVFDRVKDQYSLFHHDDGTLILFQTQITSTEYEDTTSGSYKPGQVSFGIGPTDISSWRIHLQKHDVSIEEEITWPNGAQSIYFRDPAGNRIQLRTQMQGLQDMAKAEQMREVSSGGLNAKWKIYQAAKLAGQIGSTSEN